MPHATRDASATLLDAIAFKHEDESRGEDPEEGRGAGGEKSCRDPSVCDGYLRVHGAPPLY